MADSGENWSVGQRQLLCLGRVILKQTQILFMDEATASVDSQTDATIQRITRQEFSSCTIISIAHRIPTVMDCDRVLVLEAGTSLQSLCLFVEKYVFVSGALCYKLFLICGNMNVSASVVLPEFYTKILLFSFQVWLKNLMHHQG